MYDSGIRPAISAYLQEKSEELRNYGSYWSASSAGYCQRLVIMRRLGVPKAPELQESQDITTRTFEAGHVFHEWIQRITKANGLSIAQEVELQDEDLMIRGHFDDLVLVKKLSNPSFTFNTETQEGTQHYDGHLILYDYKTAHSKWFEYAKGRPMSHYNKMQLGTYMYMLRKTIIADPSKMGTMESQFDFKLTNLTEARILKISKDDLRLHEMQLLWDDKLEQEVLGYWTSLNKLWEAKKLPPCTCLDVEGGFMGKRSKAGKVYNDYFYEDEPCSLKWYEHCKKEGLLNAVG